MTEKERIKIKNRIKEEILETEKKIQEYSELSRPISLRMQLEEFQEWMQ